MLLDDLAREFQVSSKSDCFELKKGSLQFFLRKQGSDVQVAHQIFFAKEYLPVINFMKLRNQEINTFLDLGANIGLTSLFLNQFFPRARIASVEPDHGNFEMLMKNFEYSRLDTAQAFANAVWFEKTQLKLSRNFADGQDWAINVITEDLGSNTVIETVTMRYLMVTLGWSHIDFLKVDIEGAEGVLFDSDLSDLFFLDAVSIIAIEMHDEVMKPQKIIDLLSTKGFLFFQTGELHVFYK